MPDTVPLDERTCRYFERNLAQMRALEAALNGALALLIEQNELQGRWQLDMANKQLVRMDAPQEANTSPAYRDGKTMAEELYRRA